jgi:hypothetical protein
MAMTRRQTLARSAEAHADARRFFTTARGRPRKGTKAEGSSARSLRLPDSAWSELTREARARKLTLHKLLRLIVAQHLSASTRPPIPRTVLAKRAARQTGPARRSKRS